jgi:hypothetical protein
MREVRCKGTGRGHEEGCGGRGGGMWREEGEGEREVRRREWCEASSDPSLEHRFTSLAAIGVWVKTCPTRLRKVA